MDLFPIMIVVFVIGIMSAVIFFIINEIFNPMDEKCARDCGELNYEYFKYDPHAGFGGSDNCWCLNEYNESMQIW